VERQASGEIAGTTIYRPIAAQFDDDDREQLKLLNICDPYVAEFFFGGKTIVVEGDTEFTAFKYVITKDPKQYDGVHIVRARGKATIVSLCKILNQFGAPYAVLHDSDRPTYRQKDGKECKNPAWSQNETIRDVLSAASAGTRLVASIPNFEGAYLGQEVKADKPYNVLRQLTADPAVLQNLKQLLDALVEFEKPLPTGALEWADVDQLLGQVQRAQ
jgi:putative ATP-dependent endonuclease of OLD family